MSGMYNLVFGMNPYSDSVLECLGLKKEDFGRFRDVFVANGKIAVYTRCGGGNRPDYQHVFEKMAAHPNFLHAKDDSFDETYCTFYFSFPEGEEEVLNLINSPEEFDPDARWQAAINAISRGS